MSPTPPPVPPESSDEEIEPIEIPQAEPDPEEEEPIALVGDDEEESLGLEDAPSGSSKIQAFGAAAAAGRSEQKFSRKMNLTGAGATRCRVFHSKITVAAIEHMINTINEWLDGSEAEIKHVSEVVGTMEGKKPEPNIIVTVWY
jgi:hypothetical protein